jgi:hypothetical protein
MYEGSYIAPEKRELRMDVLNHTPSMTPNSHFLFLFRFHILAAVNGRRSSFSERTDQESMVLFLARLYPFWQAAAKCRDRLESPWEG